MATHVTGSVPYRWPYDGALDPTRTALVLCGVQRRFTAAAPDSHAVTAQLVGLAVTLRELGGVVVWVRHGARPGRTAASTFLPVRGDDGWQPSVEPAAGDVLVDAAGWDGCYGSDLDHSLRATGVRTVVLGGIASELTVDSTVRTLNDRGHECLVLTDGCAPLVPSLGARAHHSLTMSGGIFGALGTTDHVADALVSTLSDQQFAPTARSSS